MLIKQLSPHIVTADSLHAPDNYMSHSVHAWYTFLSINREISVNNSNGDEFVPCAVKTECFNTIQIPFKI
jgi:hypothetical protein